MKFELTTEGLNCYCYCAQEDQVPEDRYPNFVIELKDCHVLCAILNTQLPKTTALANEKAYARRQERIAELEKELAALKGNAG
jgi:hypothetical protein